MKKAVLVCCALALTVCAQAQWKPAGDKIKTKWAEQINPQNVLPEYPRPQLERTDWVNLNGEWEYAIKPKGEVEPNSFDGNILVPFAVESSLSGVQKEVGENNELWYKRSFAVPANWKNKDVVLNFGAVDWKADVFVNDILIGSHQGGFTPFSFNITPYLTGKSNQKLVVRVWDPSDRGYQPRGKQTSNPEGIWYTPVTGIWQTVWLEPVATNHITSVKSIPNIDNGTMNVTVGTSQPCNTAVVEVKLLDKGQVVASAKGVQGKELRLAVQNPTLWDTSNPYLYDMKVSLTKDGKVVDDVKSYTAFRKISSKRDANGIMRMQLNNKNLFQYGPLDQGWWPDGLYTAPTDEALQAMGYQVDVGKADVLGDEKIQLWDDETEKYKDLNTAEISALAMKHIVLQNKITDFSQKKIYPTKKGLSYVTVFDGGVGCEANTTEPFQPVKLGEYFNGITYSLDNVLGNVDVSLAEELEANYSEFWKLMKKAGLVENINGEEVMTFIVGETVMAFLPDNDVVKAQADILPDDPEELKNYLKYFFVSIDANKLSNFLLPGIGEPGMYQTTQISPESTLYDTFYSQLGIYPDEQKFNLVLRNEVGKEIETPEGVFPGFLSDALIYNINTIDFQSNNK